ncbi:MULTISPECIES: hypothetical protein [Streptococcus anginosus group]|uniref:hypothetical protein n=1 Tax=Streptococcus anginosus group TaxID=671232 RepID=UPI000C855B9C|nr:hypothetical protein [Streptococcus intermedius]PMR65698.1 hypothetical protein C1I62_05940 [Streptococcus intermedius]
MAQIFFADDILEEEVRGNVVGFTFDEQRKAKFGIKLTKGVDYPIVGYDYSANKAPVYLGLVVESDEKTGSVRVSSIEKQLSNLLKPLTETKTQLLDEIEELKSEIDKKEKEFERSNNQLFDVQDIVIDFERAYDELQREAEKTLEQFEHTKTQIEKFENWLKQNWFVSKLYHFYKKHNQI